MFSLLLFFGYLLLATCKMTTVASSKCQTGWVEFQHSCYLFKSNETEFSTAESSCISLGGHLASVHNGFVNAWLTSEAGEYIHTATEPEMWIGLNNLMVHGNWSWTDGSNYDFTEWYSTPENSPMSCVGLSLRTGEAGGWKDGDCFDTKPYVCEIMLPTPSPPPTTTTTTAKPMPQKNCTDGWYYFEPTNTCYGINRYNGADIWQWAEYTCQSQNAHLVSIHSNEEAKFISGFGSVLGAKLWTGHYSTDNKFSWRWNDGSNINWLQWAPGYPNLQVSSCAYLWLSKLYDLPCNSTINYVCKKNW